MRKSNPTTDADRSPIHGDVGQSFCGVSVVPVDGDRPEPLTRRRVSYYWLAERYDVSVATITNWRTSGKMPMGFLLGGRRLFWLDEILAWEAASFPRTNEEK